MRQFPLFIRCIPAAATVAGLNAAVYADVVAGWTFPQPFSSTSTFGNGKMYAPPPFGNPMDGDNADQGMNASSGHLYGFYNGNGTRTFASGPGNGSAYGFYLSNLTQGGGFQVEFSTIGAGNSPLSISFDMARWNLEQSSWVMTMSVDQFTFYHIGNFTVTQNGAFPLNPWSASSPRQDGYTNTLSLPSWANNQTKVILRWELVTSNNPASGCMIDNVFVTNNVPAPGALALLGLAGMAGSRRRRA